MAGLSGPQAVIDVVAASERLVPSVVPEPSTEQPRRLERPGPEPTEIGAPETTADAGQLLSALEARCSFGHLNSVDSRFCSSCGLPLGLSAPSQVGSPARPRPLAELSPAERDERDRQHAEALAAAARFEAQPPQLLPAEGETMLIHFVADGLTAFGQVWYRGQELEIGPAHPRWSEALNWITLSRFEQAERWGEQKFDHGPWPGRRSYADGLGSFEQLSVTAPDGRKVPYAGPSEAELRAADEAERRRGRAVPAPAFG